jgi:hypothetical protein
MNLTFQLLKSYYQTIISFAGFKLQFLSPLPTTRNTLAHRIIYIMIYALWQNI